MIARPRFPRWAQGSRVCLVQQLAQRSGVPLKRGTARVGQVDGRVTLAVARRLDARHVAHFAPQSQAGQSETRAVMSRNQ